MKSKAVEKAKKQAEALLNPLNQKVGKAIYINDELTLKGDVIPDDPTLYGQGGDKEERAQSVDCKMSIDSKLMTVKFKAPDKEGGFRIYAYVHDGKNHAATANVPFFVQK